MVITHILENLYNNKSFIRIFVVSLLKRKYQFIV